MMKYLFVVVVLVQAAISVAAQECEQLQSASADEMISYLKKGGDERCMTFAIDRIGTARYEPAIPVLVRLLDFRRLPNSEELSGGLSMQSWYPATNALEEVGKAALPSLLQAISSIRPHRLPNRTRLRCGWRLTEQNIYRLSPL
jgi:hypothetical protein